MSQNCFEKPMSKQISNGHKQPNIIIVHIVMPHRNKCPTKPKNSHAMVDVTINTSLDSFSISATIARTIVQTLYQNKAKWKFDSHAKDNAMPHNWRQPSIIGALMDSELFRINCRNFMHSGTLRRPQAAKIGAKSQRGIRCPALLQRKLHHVKSCSKEIRVHQTQSLANQFQPFSKRNRCPASVQSLSIRTVINCKRCTKTNSVKFRRRHHRRYESTNL